MFRTLGGGGGGGELERDTRSTLEVISTFEGNRNVL